MWNGGGQVDLLSFAGVRGGGKGGGGGGAAPVVLPDIVLTDPVTGKTYTEPAGGTLDPNTGEIVKGSAARQLNADIEARRAQEKLDTQAKDTAATTKGETDLAKFNTRKDQAYNDALAAVTRSFQQQGLDPNQYMQSDIIPELTRQRNTIQDLDPNPAAAFPTSLGSTILSNLTSGKRSEATNRLNAVFDPNYAQSLIADTADDPYIDTILSEQFDPLSSQLENARKRNTLTDTGYNAALSTLAQKRSAARDTVSSLGSNILNTDRGGINDIIGSARTAASGLNLNDTFDPSTYVTQARDKATGYLGNLGGSLRNAVGGTKFADIQELINAGGAVQGANNPTAANPNAIGGTTPTAEDELAKQKRGLGSTGAF